MKRVTVIADTDRVIPASRAFVEYTHVGEEGEEVRKTRYSPAVGPIEIQSYEAYRRAKKDFTKEWSIFTAGASIPILLPIFVWYALSTTNDRLEEEEEGMMMRRREDEGEERKTPRL